MYKNITKIKGRKRWSPLKHHWELLRTGEDVCASSLYWLQVNNK